MSLSNQEQLSIFNATTSKDFNQVAHFQEVNVDCWEKIFDYVSLREIIAMGQTCKRMRRVAGYYFHRNFAYVQCNRTLSHTFGIGIYVIGVYGLATLEIGIRKDFCQFINKLWIFRECASVHSLNAFSSLKILRLCSVDLTETQLAYIKDLFDHIESVELCRCVIHGDFFEQFLKHCPNLKRLHLIKITFDPNYVNSWLLHKYPKLRNFKHTMDVDSDSLKVFFLQNPNLSHYEVKTTFFWANKHILSEANVHLNTLTLGRLSYKTYTPIELVDQLYTLHSLGIYKSLHLEINSWNRETEHQALANGLAALKPFKRLIIGRDIDLSNLIHLRELYILESLNAINMQSLAQNLVKLEVLCCYWITTVEEILPFFGNSKRLRVVKLVRDPDWEAGPRFGYDLNLFALNEEREKLDKAKKVIIYPEEDVYLATKWATQNMSLRLVDIVRKDSKDIW